MTEDNNDRFWTDYTESLREQIPALVNSSVIIHIAEGVPEKIDSGVIQAATQMGLMLLLDTPLLIVQLKGQRIPKALRRAAAAVVPDADMADPKTQDRVAAAIKRITPRR